MQPEEKPEMTKSKNTAKTWKQNSPVKLKFSFKEAREYETIDDDIASLEEQLEKLEQDILKNATNSVKTSELVQAKRGNTGSVRMKKWNAGFILATWQKRSRARKTDSLFEKSKEKWKIVVF